MDNEISIHFTDRCARFVQQQVREGRFDSPTQIVETALLMLEERETKCARLLALFEQAESRERR